MDCWDQPEVCRPVLIPIDGKVRSRSIEACRAGVREFLSRETQDSEVPLLGALHEPALQDHAYHCRDYKCNRQKPLLLEHKPFDVLARSRVKVQKRKNPHDHQCAAPEAGKEYDSDSENDKRDHTACDDSNERTGPNVLFRKCAGVPYSGSEYSARRRTQNADRPSHERHGKDRENSHAYKPADKLRPISELHELIVCEETVPF